MDRTLVSPPARRRVLVAVVAATVAVSLGGGFALFDRLGPGRDVRAVAVPDSAVTGRGAAGPAGLPVMFEANHGQTDPEVQFLARGQGYGLFLTRDEFVLRLSKPSSGPSEPAEAPSVLRMSLVGSRPAPEVKGLDRLAGTTNYLSGDDPAGWLQGVANYAKVSYDSVYPGIDLVFHAGNGPLEYDFVVAPGADPSVIAVAFDGGRPVEVDVSGDLILDAGIGQLRQPAPTLYQDVDGVRRQIVGRYAIGSGGNVGFEVGGFDASRPLVIDPVLPYATQLGGGDDEGATGIAVDPSGSAYITGWTESTDFPTKNPFDGSSDPGFLTTFCVQAGRGTQEGCGDAFVAKLDPSGGSLVYATYLGGRDPEGGTAIAVGPDGSAHVTGYTLSDDFPVKDGAQAKRSRGSSPDGFVAKLSPDGSTLAYSTFLGGTWADTGNGIAVDNSGMTYVTGFAGDGLPTKDPAQPACSAQPVTRSICQDAFVAKLDTTKSGDASLVYSTYLGGDGADRANAIATDPSGNAYITGTAGEGFPTKNALQPKAAGGGTCPPTIFTTAANAASGTCPDAFVVKLNQAGAVDYATYLGGPQEDRGNGIAVDASGHAYVTGLAGPDLVTKNGSQAKNSGKSDAFVVKLSKDGKTVDYATYLGGSGTDAGRAIAVDPEGKVYVTGVTSNLTPTAVSNFPVKDALQPARGGSGDVDGFVAHLDPSRAGDASLVFSTFLGGGGGDDLSTGIASGPDDSAYVSGYTESIGDFPTIGGLQPKGKGGVDAFVAKLGSVKKASPVVTQVSPRSAPPGTKVVLTGRGFTGATQVQFGATGGADYRVSADGTQIVVRTPPSDPGPVTVVVTTAKGVSGPSPSAQFVYAEGAWSDTGALATPRDYAAAALLSDGKVLVTGGCVERAEEPAQAAQAAQAAPPPPAYGSCTRATASAEVFDPASGKWSPTGDMTTPRHSGHTATVLSTGKVLVAGGTGPEGRILASAEIYDPVAGTWAATAPPTLPAPEPVAFPNRAAPAVQTTPKSTATLLPNGTVLVLGASRGETFDPASGTWKSTSAPVGPATGVEYHSAVLLADGKVLVVSAERAPQLYDPGTDKWTAQPQMMIPRVTATATPLPAGKILVAGGRAAGTYSSVAELYDPSTKEWSAGSTLEVARYDHVATLLASGKVLITGGRQSDGGSLASAELYDPATSKWRTAGLMSPISHTGSTATLLKDGRVLVAGGGTATAELYDPAPSQAGDLGPQVAAATKDGGGGTLRLLALGGVAAVVVVGLVLLGRAVSRRRRR